MIWEVLGFLLKTGVVGVMLLIVIGVLIKGLQGDDDGERHGQFTVKHLNEELRREGRAFKSALVPQSSRALAEKAFARQEKQRQKAERKRAKRTLKEQQKLSKLTPAHSAHDHSAHDHSAHDHSAHDHSAHDEPQATAPADDEPEVGTSPLEAKIMAALDEREKPERARSEESGELTFSDRPRLFVLDFKGDVQASAVENLRREVSAVLEVASEGDRVLVRLENSGGYVHTHGLAASQLKRLTEASIELWVTVDKVAASGGYLMACVADHIVAAPFSIIGSIGVMAQVPNINRLLKRFDVDVELHTAGKYKRTLTTMGENTEEGRAKFIEDLQITHELFKGFVREARPNLDVEQVATGETWLGMQAIEVGLIDEVKTSDELILSALDEYEVYTVHYHLKRGLSERFMSAAHNLLAERLPL